VLNKVSLGFPVPDAAALLMPATAALLQLNVVPGVELAGIYEKTVLLHIAPGVSVLDNLGEG
jgi:hypothetical protein